MILEKKFGVTVESYRDVFRKLVLHGVIDPDTGKAMEEAASLRNMIVHRYWQIDDERIYREAKGNNMAAIESFVSEVRNYVSKDC